MAEADTRPHERLTELRRELDAEPLARGLWPGAEVVRANAKLRRDPTRTVTLRKKYSAEAYRRFRSLKGLINATIVKNDALRLDSSRGVFSSASERRHQDVGDIPHVVPATDFKFTADPAKVDAFMDWLRTAEDAEILAIIRREGRTVVERQAWQNVYIRAAYERGLFDADDKLRAAGFPEEFIRETPSRLLPPSFRPITTPLAPIHADALGLLYTRNFRELQGITQAMDQQISRELAEGLAQGLGRGSIARNINDRVDKVGIFRARVLARTEIVRAHAEATLNRFQQFGLHEVRGLAELATAGDDRVCTICEGLEGTTLRIDAARGLIPVHPQCRCTWLPVIPRELRRAA